jgi:hypothetical protein
MNSIYSGNMLDLTLKNRDKYLSTVFVLLIIFLSSCNKQGKGMIVKNHYKGYGFFWFENDFQDSFTELRFIPVGAGKDDLLHFRNLNPQMGLDTYCYYGDSFLRTLVSYTKYSEIISDEFGYVDYLIPVYIEFEEVPDYQKIYPRKGGKKEAITWNLKDSLNIKYILSYESWSDLIKINKIEFFSFYSQKDKECNARKKNSYKGYGIFYFMKQSKHSSAEVYFIPVCTEKEDLLHLQNLNPQTGLAVYCDRSDDSFRNNIRMHSKIIPADSGLEYYIAPVYIEFEETGDYPERLKKSDAKQTYRQGYIPLSGSDTLKVNYFFSDVTLAYIIQINKIEFFSFVEK